MNCKVTGESLEKGCLLIHYRKVENAAFCIQRQSEFHLIRLNIFPISQTPIQSRRKHKRNLPRKQLKGNYAVGNREIRFFNPFHLKGRERFGAIGNLELHSFCFG